MQLYTPVYILPPTSDFRLKSFANVTEQMYKNGRIWFFLCCLSDDQQYLLAACSDDPRGLFKTYSINTAVPDR
jgi:hypothetical protein